MNFWFLNRGTRIPLELRSESRRTFCFVFFNRHRGTEDEESSTILKREEMTAMFVRPSSLLDSGVDVSSPHNTAGNRDRDWEMEKNHSTILAEWNSTHMTSRRSCYYPSADEDDFYALGFRPQDEITTEL